MNSELKAVTSYLQEALSAKPTPTAQREVEARWHVSKVEFFQTLVILRDIASDAGLTTRTIHIKNDQHSNLRHRRVYKISYPKSNLPVIGTTAISDEWIEKVSVGKSYDSTSFKFRVAVADEIPVKAVRTKPTLERLGTRYEVPLTPTLRADLQIEQIPGKPIDYRIELELLDNTKLEDFTTWISRITGYIQESRIPMPNHLRDEVIDKYNELMTGSKSNSSTFIKSSLPHPSDLELKDLLYGTLLARGRTSITAKADGEVTELLFLEKGIFAVSGRDQVNHIARLAIPELTPSLFQGEMVQTYEDSGISSDYTFVFFETLISSGGSVRDIPSLTDRRAYQTALTKLFKGRQDLTLLQKDFEIASTTDELYKATNKVLDSLSSLPYPTDGLIETEVDQVYREGKITIKKSKERKNLTIDLEIGANQQLLVVDDAHGFKKIPFTGSSQFPFKLSPAEFKEIFDNTEFMVVGDVWEFEFDDNYRPHPRRPRYRKSSANKLSTALNLWALIERPIREETLRGTDLELMKRYHNNAKSDLFATLKMGSTYADYGSGRGGDLRKFKKRDLKVYLLEPDAGNRAELQKRITENGFSGNVKGLVDFGAEHTDRVVKELLKGVQVDSAGMMLSWTFFNGSSEMMDKALETLDKSIKPGGTLLFTTVDGDAMVEGMRGAGMLKTPQYTIERIGGREILIDIPGSIVENQTEWLPDLVELDKRLKKRGFRLLEKKRLTDTKNFPKQQRILSAMYVTLRYVKAVAQPPTTVARPVTAVARPASSQPPPSQEKEDEEEVYEEQVEPGEEKVEEEEAYEEAGEDEEQEEQKGNSSRSEWVGLDPSALFERL